ncbi:zinc finger protein 723-like [Dendropsophus ebraccatus]|uniref:zinc finger protein 723-like n=1 Tax=Dendropsophus ebraccatus TaxID=150705 RepID=UPI003831EB4B
MQVTFDDVAVYFSEEEWRDLSQGQQELYKDVMKENYSSLQFLGIDVETPELFYHIEEWESPHPTIIRRRKVLRVYSHTETESPKPKASRRKRLVEILPAPSTPRLFALSNSDLLLENQPQMEGIPDLATPGEKKRLKDLQPKCLTCKGVYKCYCGIAKANSKKQFVCLDCGKAYSQEHHLIGHQKSHYRGQPHKCPICEKYFKKAAQLRKHQKIHKTTEYKCHKCQAVFQTEKSLKEHRKVHRELKPCPQCGENFRSFQKLKSHIREAHSKLLECSLCHQRFRYKTALVSHQREHVGSEVYKCDKCDKVYTRMTYLLRHAELHYKENGGDGNLQPKSPSEEPEGDDSHSSAHTQDVQPYPNYHEVTEEEKAPPIVIPSDPVLVMDAVKDKKFLKKERPTEELPKRFNVVRLFKCKKCKKCFRHHSTLVRHILSHQLTLTCHSCGQKFERLLKLYLHTCRHEKKKPYKCTFCKKAFSFQSLLRLHLHTHDTTKPGNGWLKPTRSPRYPSKETPPNSKFTLPSSILLHQTPHGIQPGKSPSDACSQNVCNIRISPTSPIKIPEMRPCQDMVVYKDYVKRVCYRPCE